jgi:hypothetical protein
MIVLNITAGKPPLDLWWEAFSVSSMVLSVMLELHPQFYRSGRNTYGLRE